jgi:hypothetical protein
MRSRLKPQYQWWALPGALLACLFPHADTLETMIRHVETAYHLLNPLCAGVSGRSHQRLPVGEFGKPKLTLL